MGVATVATLVLLSGCEAAMETDYAKKLEGTWTVSDLQAMVVPPSQQTPVAATANITVTIAVGKTLNTGDFTLMVVTNIADPQASVAITASGSIVVDSKNIEVTIDDIMTLGPSSLDDLEEVNFGYTVTGDSLTIMSDLLPRLGVATEITLTKSAAQ
jgi:hypothetical protein